jgi:hypothetical protein
MPGRRPTFDEIYRRGIPRDEADARYIESPVLPTGSIDHGVLAGLGDDDHATIYVRFTIGASPPSTPRAGDLWVET